MPSPHPYRRSTIKITHSSVPRPCVWMIACEPSGDALGQHLMQALREDVFIRYTFKGVGGPLMAEEGLESLFPYTELSVMGFSEVLPHLPRILKRQAQIRRALREDLPDLVITIDAPGFNFPLARYAKKLFIPTLHAVAPSVWAWRPGRAKKVARLYDHLWTILPFEPPYFEKEGLSCSFMGHPTARYDPIPRADPKVQDFRHRYGLQHQSPIISLWPGSRLQEVKTMLPLFLEAMKKVQAKYRDVAGIVPTLDHLKEVVDAHLAPVPYVQQVLPEEKFYAMSLNTLALATSGTVTLELAYAGVPMVVGYKMSPLSYKIAKTLVRSPWISLPNIILQDTVVPECIQDRCTPDVLAEEILDLLDAYKNKPTAQLDAFDILRQKMAPPSAEKAIRQPVQSILIGLKKKTLSKIFL